MSATDPNQLLRALADPTRLRIVALLRNGRELCVCDLTRVLEMVQPKVSRHLAVLREAGLLKDRKEGLWVHYRINPKLPQWSQQAIKAVIDGCSRKKPFSEDYKRLSDTGNNACA